MPGEVGQDEAEVYEEVRPEVEAAFTGRTTYALTVVTTVAVDGERSGCLAGFVTQCSIEPPRFLVCISKVNHTRGVVARAQALAVHLLGTDQADTASLFGEESGDRIDKFRQVAWHRGALGVPVLDDCAAWVVVRIIRRYDVGDHVALLTRPVDGGPGPRQGVMTNYNAPPLEPGHPAG